MLLVLRGGRAALGRQLRRARPARGVSVAALELWNRTGATGGAPRVTTGASLGAVRRYTHNPLPSPSHMSVADLLEVSKQFRSKQTNYIFETQSLGDAVLSLAKNENSATLVVVNKKQQVVGMLTNHLALERIVKLRKQSRVADWDIKVTEVMIPARELLHVSPDDSLEDVRPPTS
jgi:CBS domain-containing protein